VPGGVLGWGEDSGDLEDGTMTKVQQIETTNFAGAPDGVIHVGDRGVVAGGRNGAGKTSIARAVLAALVGAPADSVRVGSDEAEVILTTDRYVVTRRIRRADRQPPVKVETTGDAVAAIKSPQGFLDRQAPASIDPLAFFHASAKERRAMVLAALPLAIDETGLRAYDPTLPAGYDCRGNALDVFGRRHAEKYAERTAANAAAKEARRRADEARKIANATPVPADAIPVSEAERDAATARAAVVTMEAGITAARAAVAKGATTREKIAARRASAQTERAAVVAIDETARETARTERTAAESLVADLRAEMAALQVRLDKAIADETRATRALDSWQGIERDNAARIARAERFEAEAADLESLLADTAPTCATPDELTAARDAVVEAEAAVETARAADVARSLRVDADRTEAAAKAAEAKADALDTIVKALAKDGPDALIAANDGIPGLGLSGDSITLGGVALDGLCGAEQLRFAVDIAKRVGARSELRLLTIDGLERIDPDSVDAFLDYATADGWQAIVSYVQRGELSIRQIGGAA